MLHAGRRLYISSRERESNDKLFKHKILKNEKTLLILATLSFAPWAAAEPTNLYYSSKNGSDMLNVSAWGYFWNLHSAATSTTTTNIYAAAPSLKNTFNDKDNICNISNQVHMEGGVYKALLTENNSDYNLVLSGTVKMSVNSAVYFNKVDVFSTNKPTSITLDLGSEGSITTAKEFNIGNANPRPSVTLSADFAAEKMAELIASAHSGAQVIYSRDLLVAKGNDGFWNVSDSYDKGNLTFSSASLADSGLIYVGIVSSEDQIKFGEYGIVYTEASGKVNDNGVEYITLVAKTPEPATATLSLLALAGLAARRRRH